MELRPYQLEDVQKLLTQPAMGVFNEQRTGKTPTSLMTMKQRGVQRLLIVCPASLVYAWAEEYKLWTEGSAYIISSATDFNLGYSIVLARNPTALILNYENLRDSKAYKGAWETILKKYKPDGLIVDEVHRFKDRNSANFKAVSKFHNVEYRLYLSGTPAPNKPWDIWTTLHLIRPNNYTSYW